jgi:hypothetical protein
MRSCIFLSILISLNFFIETVNAKVINTTDMFLIRQEVLKLTKDDLVTFEVKGVIFSPKDQILAHKFIPKYKQFLKQIELTKGIEEAKRLDKIVLLNYEPKLVDENIPQIIKAIQHNGTKVIALTGGYTGAISAAQTKEDLRVETLKNFGIDFSSSFLVTEMRFDSLIKKRSNDLLPLYKNGILFTSRYPKGVILKIFLEKVKFEPKRIIHIDNSIKKIEDVRMFADAAGIDYLGIHYTKAHENYSQELNQAVTDKKFEILVEQDLWISDKVAQCMITTKSSIEKCNKDNLVR